MWARYQQGFVTGTCQVVKPYISRPCTEIGNPFCPAGEAQLTAGDVGVRDVPNVVTHRAPAATMEDLDTAFVWTSTANEPDVLWGRMGWQCLRWYSIAINGKGVACLLGLVANFHKVSCSTNNVFAQGAILNSQIVCQLTFYCGINIIVLMDNYLL